jgi:hypothetical protein
MYKKFVLVLMILLGNAGHIGAVIEEESSYKVASEFHHFLRHGQTPAARVLGFHVRESQEDPYLLDQAYNALLGNASGGRRIKYYAQIGQMSHLVPVSSKELPALFSLCRNAAGAYKYCEPQILIPFSFTDSLKYDKTQAYMGDYNGNPVLTICPKVMGLSDDDIGGIVSHEFGHWRLLHCGVNKENPEVTKQISYSREFEADAFASRMGYGPSLKRFLTESMQRLGDIEGSRHPKFSDRIARLDALAQNQNLSFN